jgi:hypothetical protein
MRIVSLQKARRPAHCLRAFRLETRARRYFFFAVRRFAIVLRGALLRRALAAGFFRVVAAM